MTQSNPTNKNTAYRPSDGPKAGCRKELHMREDLKRYIALLGDDDVYLLYVTALELLRYTPEESRRGQGAARGGTIKGGNQ